MYESNSDKSSKETWAATKARKFRCIILGRSQPGRRPAFQHGTAGHGILHTPSGPLHAFRFPPSIAIQSIQTSVHPARARASADADANATANGASAHQPTQQARARGTHAVAVAVAHAPLRPRQARRQHTATHATSTTLLNLHHHLLPAA